MDGEKSLEESITNLKEDSGLQPCTQVAKHYCLHIRRRVIALVDKYNCVTTRIDHDLSIICGDLRGLGRLDHSKDPSCGRACSVSSESAH
jgi:hypothetical protein